MTGSQTDPVSVPAHVIAAAAVERVASSFFTLGAMGLTLGKAEDYERWQFLRFVAATLHCRRAVSLGAGHVHQLREILDGCESTPDVEFLRSIQFAETA